MRQNCHVSGQVAPLINYHQTISPRLIRLLQEQVGQRQQALTMDIDQRQQAFIVEEKHREGRALLVSLHAKEQISSDEDEFL